MLSQHQMKSEAINDLRVLLMLIDCVIVLTSTLK